MIDSSLSLSYEFGPAGKHELKLIRDTDSEDVAYNYTLFSHAEHRSLRIANGDYHYILFRCFSALNYQGRYAEDVAGLKVLKDNTLLAKHQCKSGSEFDYDYDFEWLKKDSRH